LHKGWRLGTRIQVDPPQNYFPLHEDDRPAVLIAGGIGITPIKAMVETLATRGADFELHYTDRTLRDMAFARDLQRRFPAQTRLYFSQTPDSTRLDVAGVLANVSADAVVYVCGPTRLIDAVRQSARHLGIPAERVQFESFT